jgi:phage portal protein BeeE
MTTSQGGIPQAVIKSQRKLTAEQALAIQTQWAEATTRRNGLPPVMPPELDFEVLSINPSDLSLLETQEWNSRVIATAYGVPAVLLNMSLQGGLTYQNPASLGEMWWRFELRTTATRIANAFTAQMLPRGQWVSFDAADTFAEITEMSDDDDAQASQVAAASPSQQPQAKLTAIGGSG